MPKDRTGYDPHDSSDHPEPVVNYFFTRHPRGKYIYSGHLGILETSDGRRLGLIECDTEEEFKWIKDKLESEDRTRTTEEISRLSEKG